MCDIPIFGILYHIFPIGKFRDLQFSMNILKTILHGLVTSLGLRAMSMALRFVTICLLPLWLTPAEIGIMALILICVNLPVALADFGFGTALIKEKDASQTMFQSVFTFVIASATVIALAIILGAPLLERAFSLPAGLAIMAAFALPFNAFAIVPNAILQRELRFTNLAIRDVTGEVTFSASALILAICGFGATSIAIAVVAQRFVRWLIASISVKWTPKIAFSRSDMKQLSKFSRYQFASITITQLFNQIDKLLLAAYLSPAALGFYSQAQQFTVYPVQALSGTANNVFFASFAKVQDDEKMLQNLFVKILRGFLVANGLIIGCIAPALHLVPIFYKPEWAQVIPLALVLCLFLPAFCGFIFEGIMISMGGEKLRVKTSTLKLCLLTILTITVFSLFPSANGPMIMAAILGGATTISTSINFIYIVRHLKLTRKHAKLCIKPALLALALAATGYAISLYML